MGETLHAARRIAREEWRYWRRSRLVLAAGIVVLIVVATSLAATTTRIASEQAERQSLQAAAEDIFKSQPARHPHRMVHYGHYVVRTPVPLAAVDPGVDTYAGTVMFLEGHRQNSAVFSPFYSAAQTNALAALTPARAYQLLAPLVLIIAGYACLTRERAARTDRLVLMSAIAARSVVLGKTLAVTQLAGLLLVPLAVAILVVGLGAGDLASGLALLTGYAGYLLVWSALAVTVSGRSRSAAASLLTLLAAWLVLAIVIPGIALRAATAVAPIDGKIATDLEVNDALRDAGDGHNADDPAFAKLRNNLLAQYDVDTVEELPINIRGVVAEYAEDKQSKIMDTITDDHREEELWQTTVARQFGWLSPTLAIRSGSMLLAGTDLSQLHRFEREAEAARLDFVQSLNRLQANAMSYADDISRSSDTEAEKRTRVSAQNWQRLRTFELGPPAAGQRLATAAPYGAMLLLWLVALAFGLRTAGATLGADHG